MGFRPVLATAVALAAALTGAPPAGAAERGVVETLSQTVSTPRKAARLGAQWVRVWALWQDLEPAPGTYNRYVIDTMNAKVDALKARGIKVVVVMHHSPAWASGGRGGIAPPTDPARFGAFMGAIARQIPGVDAWELWNEPDATAFWLGAPQPDVYAALLRSAYPAIKAAQPHDIVVTGGLVGNNMDFVQALYDNGARGYFDAVGVHTDTSCLTNSPNVYYRDPRGRVGQYSFTGYREVHAVMADHGDGAKPIWMTELGWSTQSTRPRSCSIGMWTGQKRLGVSERRQARFLRAAYRCLAADPFVTVAIWFGFQDIPGHSFAGGYGLYRRNGTAKPAARAFRRLRGGIEPRRRCGGVVDRTPPRIRVAKPANGLRFSDKLSVRVRAFDNKGGAGLGRIFLALDGQHIRSWRPPGGGIRPWWGSEDWTPGLHTLTFSVRDRAFNVASVNVTVEKVKRRRARRG